MHERNRLHRKAVKSKNPADWIKYKEVKNSVNMQVRKCKSDYYCNLIEESKNQPKSLWKHLNNITSRKSNSNVSSFSKLPSTNRVQNRYNHRLDSKYFIHDVTCSLPQQTLSLTCAPWQYEKTLSHISHLYQVYNYLKIHY